MTAVVVCHGNRAAWVAVRAALRAEPDITLVAEPADGAQLREAAAQLCPDVVLIATELPDGSGFLAARDLLAHGLLPDRARIVFLAPRLDPPTVLRGLRAGGMAFVASTDPAGQALAVVRMVAAGYGLLPPTAADLLAAPAEGPSPPGEAASNSRGVGSRGLAKLTARELDVLELIADGLSNTEIAAALGLAEPTVKAHVSRVLSKLDLRHRGQAIAVAYGAGVIPAMREPEATGGRRPAAAPPGAADPR